MALTRDLGQFVSELSPNRVPDAAAAIARTGFIDCIGVMFAGREQEPTRLLQDVLQPALGPATLYFSDQTAGAPDAAWINGVAAHALDYDDVALRGHPSTVLVPAILAEAETLDVSGRDMIVAFVAGYEVWAELGRRESGYHHGKGWHPTGIFGAIAAAAACAHLRRLDPAQTAQAIALGASQSAGLMANFGTMTKPFHAGKSAHAGVMAARLAASGFTASMDALEHPQGFLAAVSPEGKVDRDSKADGLGETWRIMTSGLAVKKFPTCYCTHRAIDGMLDLVREHDVQPSDVAAVTVTLSDNFATILRNHLPQTGLAAKFSIEFAMACALIARRVGLGELTDDFVRRADVQELMPLVSVQISTEPDPGYPGAALNDRVTIDLRAGGTLAGG
ncbi:MAG: MmgE/PrpD family protein, partial [Pseudomonadota bacterium]|nr:MmgE/PrpD family protein [Pseudomonadota bacterium]